MTETKLQYPAFSRKLFANPVRNGWIAGILSWGALFAINLLISVDLSFVFVIALIVCYKVKKKKLATYDNPPALDNMFKFYLNCGLAVLAMSCIAVIFLFAL